MTSWLSSLPLCCAPLASCITTNKRQRRSKFLSNTTAVISWPLGRSSDEELLMGQDDEKHPPSVVFDQPLYQPRPVAVPETTDSFQQDLKEKGRSRGFASSRSGFTGRKRLWSSSSSTSSRRPQISAPSNFRHVSSASLRIPDCQPPSAPVRPQQPPQDPRLRHRSFRPLELSIYAPDNHLSPILPHFDPPTITQPPPAYTRERPDEEQDLAHQRSYSSLSFHIPRKPTYESSPSTIQGEVPPLIPPKAKARNRAYTSPEVDSMKERVASAMIEVERLQRQIDEVIERQSLYTGSRPSTSHSMARTMPELEPMPSIPALPPAAPSFAERLNTDIERPHTAPIKPPVRIPNRAKPFDEASAIFNNPPPPKRDDRPLPPPLPLVLRPPLRKKKSFSRVSNWLFLGPEHKRELSLDSVTNLPRPVKGNEGFYQCVLPGETPDHRPSLDSVGTVTTWATDDEDRTVPTTWSPGSTPAAKQEEQPMISRTATFGKNDSRPGRTSVGVAF